MKSKNIRLILSVLLVPILLTGCNSGGLTNRYQDDRSNQMGTINMTEESYTFSLTQSLSSISSLHYNLINQLNSIKNNYSDSFAKEQALNSITALKNVVQEKRIFIEGLKEPESKTASKQMLIKGLDTYTSKLSNLETTLNSGNSKNLQSSMDVLSAALENIKQHQF